ncbi:MAG: DUF962 domain-containing protein [Planctomycetia bacterium]
MAARRSVGEWLDAYGECHRHPINKAFHWVCVPAITVSVLALIASLPCPALLRGVGLDWAVIVVALATLFYLRLSPRLAVGMVLFSALALAAIRMFAARCPVPLWGAALGVFVVAWVGQFIGHAIEGKKPSFLDDVKFLLIAPIWLLADLYRRLGLWPAPAR